MVNRASALLIRAVSVFFRALGWRACRFHPTCSEYASEAFQKLRWFEAARLSLSRLARCQPFSRGGFDPVPEKKS